MKVLTKMEVNLAVKLYIASNTSGMIGNTTFRVPQTTNVILNAYVKSTTSYGLYKLKYDIVSKHAQFKLVHRNVKTKNITIIRLWVPILLGTWLMTLSSLNLFINVDISYVHKHHLKTSFIRSFLKGTVVQPVLS